MTLDDPVRRGCRVPSERRIFSDQIADAVPVPGDAPLIDRLVAWNGRRPW